MKPGSEAQATLTRMAESGIFEMHDISAHLDASGLYRLPFQREFPLSLRAFRYRAGRFTQGATWHEQLELFCVVDGVVDVRMGSQTVKLGPGDLLVVDNQKLHHVVDHPRLDARVVVVSFLPELVYSLGSSSHDYAFLLPFYAQLEERPNVLRSTDPAAQEAAAALGQLVAEFFAPPETPYREAACKARLLGLLTVLLRRFQDADVMRWQFERRRQMAQRFVRLLEHLRRPEAGKLSLGEAARMCGMSTASFTRSFKQVAGMPYLAYVTHLRLGEAARLLRIGDRSIAEIADALGFADQSHFDRRFKRAFGTTPSQFQRRHRPEA
jgi:AraC-like DNA-binding protein/mannose-6-phosphate isomerase-like protein (cupin superfamily)